MAMIAVTLIVASGIANAGFRVAGSLGKLFYTDYGDALLVSDPATRVLPPAGPASAAILVTSSHCTGSQGDLPVRTRSGCHAGAIQVAN